MTDGFTSAAFPVMHTSAHKAAEEAARGRGFASGYAEGARKAEKELAERRAELEAEFAAETRHMQARAEQQTRSVKAVLAALDERINPVIEDVQNSLAAATLALTEAVIGVELSDDDTRARAIVTRTLSSTAGTATNTVRLHPADLPFVEPLVADLDGIRLVPDASLNRGDAIAALPDGFLDATIGTALDRARSELLGGSR